MKDLTKKELQLLQEIQKLQNEKGHSDFLSTNALSKKNAGIINSLEKKGLIYNSYSDCSLKEFKDLGAKKRFKMWCITEASLNFVSKPQYWEQ